MYGWQRECDIDNKDIRTKYWDVHKSGYNKEIMYFYLSRNGFIDVDIKTVDKWHLVAVGYKIWLSIDKCYNISILNKNL